MKKVEFFVMSYGEWDKLVNQTYGKWDYEVVAEEEANNYSCLKMEGVKREELADFYLRDIKDWISGENHQAPGKWQLATDMCNNGILEPGNYLIEISW